MPARALNLGRTGVVLLLANEVRGVLMVAAMLTGGGDAGLDMQELQAMQARAACAIASTLCGPADRPGEGARASG